MSKRIYKIVLFSKNDDGLYELINRCVGYENPLFKTQQIRMLNNMKNLPQPIIENYTGEEKKERETLIKRISPNVKRGSKAKRTAEPEIYYFYDRDSMCNLFKEIQSDDETQVDHEIQIHCEGNPMILGIEESERHLLTAYQFALMLALYEKQARLHQQPALKIKPLTVSIMSCHSAVTCPLVDDYGRSYTVNMARDVSAALANLGYTNWKVTGYHGYINVEDGKKDFNVVAFKRGTKPSGKIDGAEQGSLEKCSSTYVAGEPEFCVSHQRTNLHVSAERLACWQSSENRYSDYRKYNRDDMEEFEDLECVSQLVVIEPHLKRDIMEQIRKRHIESVDLLNPEHQVASKYMFFKSPKTAQEAFDEEPEISPRKTPDSA